MPAIIKKVHKLHLKDVQGISPETISNMMRQGTIEIIVSASDGHAWGQTLGRFFDKVERNVDGWREHMRNKTVIVNFVDPH